MQMLEGLALLHATPEAVLLAFTHSVSALAAAAAAYVCCSMVTVVGATSGLTARVKLGEACDVTNDCTLMAGTTVGKNACLGVFTYGAPGQNFEDYSITLGDFKLR
jgi:acetyltransferase-like isoleucine patch superfamily enzyme